MLVVAHGRRSKTVLPLALSKSFAPKRFPKGLIAKGQVVFEVDKAYVTKNNVHGVGRAFGTVDDPFGGQVLVQWHDNPDNPENVSKSDLKLAPQVGDEFIFTDEQMVKCIKYTEEGCQIKRIPADMVGTKRRVVVHEKIRALFVLVADEKIRAMINQNLQPMIQKTALTLFALANDD